MITINKNQSIPKKFSSIIKTIEEFSDNVAIISKYLLGSGVVNTDKVFSSDFQVNNGTIDSENKYRMYFRYSGTDGLTMAYRAGEKTYVDLTSGNEFTSEIFGFDENTLISGDKQNTLKFSHGLIFQSSSTNYSRDFFSALYINGTPQPTEHINELSLETSTQKISVGFSKIRGGTIYPEPRDIDGGYSDLPILEDGTNTYTLWKSDFGYTDSKGDLFLKLSFPHLRSATTSRLLVAEVYEKTQGVKTHFPVPKDIADEKTGLYYSIDQDDETVIIIPTKHFDTLVPTEGATPDDELLLKFYFVLPLQELSPFGSSAAFSKKYKIPFKRIEQVDDSFKILAHNTETGDITDLVQTDVTIVGSSYTIDYESSSVEIYNVIPGITGSNIDLYIANVDYAPPIQIDFSGDLANHYGIYGPKGTSFVTSDVTTYSDLPATLYVYTYLGKRETDFVSVLGEDGKLITDSQVEESDIRFTIREVEISAGSEKGFLNTDYIRLGTLTRGASDSNYTFTINSAFTTPYENLKAIAAEIQAAGTAYDIYRVRDTGVAQNNNIANPVTYTVRIGWIPSGAETINLYGYVGNIDAYWTSTQKTFTAELNLINTTSSTTTLFKTVATTQATPYNTEYLGANYETSPADTMDISGTVNEDRYLELKITVTDNDGANEGDFTIEADMDFFLTFK